MAEENTTHITDRGETLASWQFPEFKKYERTVGWYVTMAILVGGLSVFAVLTANYMFLVLIVLFVLIYVARARREPQLLTISLTEDGVSIGAKTFYEWKEIKNFWIIYEPPKIKNLYFDFKGGLRPGVSISLENQNPLKIRKILAEYLIEDTERENESISDGFARFLKL